METIDIDSLSIDELNKLKSDLITLTKKVTKKINKHKKLQTPKYKFDFDGKSYEVNTLHQIVDITGKPLSSIHRFIHYPSTKSKLALNIETII